MPNHVKRHRALRTRKDWLLDLAHTGAKRALRSERATGYIGWTIAENLGDNAMFEAAQRLLAGSHVERFSGARREALLANLGLSGTRTFQHVYLGGGTLINHGYLEPVRRALDLGLTVSTLGTGVGSSGFSTTTETISDAWRSALIRFDRVGVRGPRSLRKLQDIGVAKAEVVGDLALALTPDAPVTAREGQVYLLSIASPGKHEPDFPTAEMIKALAAAMRWLAQRDWRPLPVAFCPEDVAPTREALEQAGLDRVDIAAPQNAAEFFQLADRARFALGVRLHCAVLSCCAGLAPLGVAYRDKGLDFAETMELENWTLDARTVSETLLIERLEALLPPQADMLGDAVHERALRYRERLKAYVAES